MEFGFSDVVVYKIEKNIGPSFTGKNSNFSAVIIMLEKYFSFWIYAPLFTIRFWRFVNGISENI